MPVAAGGEDVAFERGELVIFVGGRGCWKNEAAGSDVDFGVVIGVEGEEEVAQEVRARGENERSGTNRVGLVVTVVVPVTE